ncbi:hypothetical protein EXIGLDRAFT_725690 [Exidia glandulosa HHB12029]|uniref:Calcium permease n=1 Tax=Exidia glandulosa HHB12029 TaxID=1314781 RepID=A0A165Q8C6_EXIGL|nr:hypothetical protein EXIGLDRAFT_725690 [Exidia glandulosa HHB12029]
MPVRVRSDAGSDDERETERDDVLSHRSRSAAGLSDDDDEGDPVTLKERQSLINVEHPFGLPIWKPALYKKSRTVTRNAETALHSEPSAAAERHWLPGNIFWTVVFGWWLALVCFVVAALLAVTPKGGRRYAWLVFGLGWYIVWPFGKYVEGDRDPFDDDQEAETDGQSTPRHRDSSVDSSAGHTVRGSSSNRLVGIQEDLPDEPSYFPHSPEGTIRPQRSHQVSSSWNSHLAGERSSLIRNGKQPSGVKVYGSIQDHFEAAGTVAIAEDYLGRAIFWLALITIIAPLLLVVCTICWALVVTIPMAKLTWELLNHMFTRPTSIRFCAAPVILVHTAADAEAARPPSPKYPRLFAGQSVPSGSGNSTVLLCTYKAVGAQYYKYTVGGVNILFVNLIPVVFFVIFDHLVILPYAERREEHGQPVSAFVAFLASRAFIFILSLLSVIPLSYFIGMAVASISAQSSIGMGAVINATFGSIIEIILYAIALIDGKGALVEGSIIGSILAGVLLMPGASMCSAAVRKKEQTFNAKSAGVTSTMLIMAIIGALAPTMFYQTYGNFEMICEGCPAVPGNGTSNPWICKRCYFNHPNPAEDPFYLSTVKYLAYFCASILVFAYLIGLWFSLRTHASQIWQNPQQLLNPLDQLAAGGTGRMSIYHKLLNPPAILPQRRPQSLTRKSSVATTSGSIAGPSVNFAAHANPSGSNPPASPSAARRTTSYSQAYTPLIETVNQAVKSTGLQPPAQLNADEFTRAVAVATVSALRHQTSPMRMRTSGGAEDGGDGGHGGHDAPSWSRGTSATVLLACTALYAMIAEILVDVVDVVLAGSGIDEKLLGITLFALVPNTTEFMNAMSFALNGNIALSMEIGSAYALQVCLLQIPAMVAFSAWWIPRHPGSHADPFTLIFPRWDVISIILSIFLLTYTYIEAKSNYHRGSILILSYLVLVAGFYFAPHGKEEAVSMPGTWSTSSPSLVQSVQLYAASLWQ